MPNITLSITEEVKRRMDSHPHIKWSNVVRSIIGQKLADFEEAGRLAGKSSLKMEDFKGIEKKINASARRHAEALLRESDR